MGFAVLALEDGGSSITWGGAALDDPAGDARSVPDR